MSTHHFDRYIDASSAVHALDARIKLVFTLLFVLVLALLPRGAWLALALAALVLWLAVVQARVGLRVIIGRSFVAAPFALIGVTLLFSRTGTVLFDVPVGFATLQVTDTGVLAFATLLVKSWLSVQASLLLMATTHVADVLVALRALRLPATLVAILGFAYRYLFVMTDEAQRMLRARDCRSATLAGRRAGGTIRWRATVTGRMAGTLFLRAYERSERIYLAMLARGYDGEPRSMAVPDIPSAQRVALVAGLVLLVALLGLSHFF